MSRRTGLMAMSLALVVSCIDPWPEFGRAQTDDADRETALHLADLLRAGRSVVSAHQDLINDAGMAEKNFNGEKLVLQANAIFAENYGARPSEVAGSERDRRLSDALSLAMHAVVEQHQTDINRKGVGFKGFIPAVFGRLTGEEFAERAGGEARIRVTAPPELVRNRKSRPDAWEEAVIESRFLSGDWPRGEPYTETVEVEGRPAFRMMLPEYYTESCLACHGGPAGEVDITGYPKEGGEAGDLGGVISITIFR